MIDLGYRGVPVTAKPITRVRPGSDGRPLAGRRIVAHLLSRNPELVSRHCDPVACDVVTRALLYDVEAVAETLATRGRRRRRTRSAT